VTHGDFAGGAVCPWLVLVSPFSVVLLRSSFFSGLWNYFACLSLSFIALPAFMRPAKWRSSLRGLHGREFD